MKVVTAVVNNPIFIQIQYYTLKKYMKCDYEFIVFNDAKEFPDFTNGGDITVRRTIEEHCKQLRINCINIPNNHHSFNDSELYKNPSYRTAESMNFILEYQKNKPDNYLLLDSDMFLIDYFDIEQYNKYDCSVVLQHRKNIDNSDIHYIWNGIYYFNIYQLDTFLMNWHCTLTTDTGGRMSTWLKSKTMVFPNMNELTIKYNEYNESSDPIEINKIHFMKYLKSCSWNINNVPKIISQNQKLVDFLISDPRNKNGNFFCELYDNKFFHYRAGGNWEKQNFNTHVDLSYKLKHALL